MNGVYGAPPTDLAEVAPDARQLSPLVPGAESLAELGEGALGGLAMVAPPGTLERRYALAAGLRATAPGARAILLAPKDRGGARLRRELEAFGCDVEESAKAHHRICTVRRPEVLAGVAEAMAEGGPRFVEALGLWTQPGVFSWDRIDPGSQLLAERITALAGEGADLGCGVGHLARAVLASPKVERLSLIDVDGRAVEAARRNLQDPRAVVLWADLQGGADAAPSGLDFVVMNPPFHNGGAEDRRLGQVFIRRAAAALRKGGALWMVANRHLPYEAALSEAFSHVDVRADQGGYKLFEARR